MWTTIPGETPIDPSGLKIKGVHNRAQLHLLEIENIQKAFLKYLGNKPNRRTARFDVPWCRQVHRAMFSDVWRWAGKFRTRPGANLGVEPHQIQPHLQDLMDDLAEREKHLLDHLETAAWLHHRAVWIHPFPNGNGRWSRLLTNIWLRLHDRPLIHWPDPIGEQSPVRAEYLAAIKAADRSNLVPLIDLHRRFYLTRTPGA